MGIFNNIEMKRNDIGANTITRKQAEELGIDLSEVSICRKIRNIARTQTITIREDEHSSGIADVLYKYLEYCGIDTTKYVKDYLSNLQPYLIKKLPEEKYNSSNKKVYVALDIGYQIALYIKLEVNTSTNTDTMVVSFHESYKKGRNKELIPQKSNRYINNKKQYVPVFKDSYESINTNTGNAIVKVFVKRGLLKMPIVLAGVDCEDFCIVDQMAIERQLIDYSNKYIEELYEFANSLEHDLNQENIRLFSELQQISFTSYGNDKFSTFSLLIDSFLMQNDPPSRAAADFALTTYSKNLILSIDEKEELVTQLENKYNLSTSRILSCLIQKIKDNFEIDSKRDITLPIDKTNNESGDDDN